MMSSIRRIGTSIALLAVLLIAGCKSQEATVGAATDLPLRYTVDMTNRSDDLFEVSLMVDDLGPENAVYQFASTAPGTYSVMNIGRFVQSFSAFDAAGNEIESEYLAPNQWRISSPEDVVEIRYAILETWDTVQPEDNVGIMSGTSLEADHVLINGQSVVG